MEFHGSFFFTHAFRALTCRVRKKETDLNIRLPWKGLHKKTTNSEIFNYSFVYNSGSYPDSFIKMKLFGINKTK